MNGCSNKDCSVCTTSSASSGGSTASTPNTCSPDSCTKLGGNEFCARIGHPVCTLLPDFPCILCGNPPGSSSSRASVPQSSSAQSSVSSAQSSSVPQSSQSSSVLACVHICGNNLRECAEECDDGNLENDDGCSTTCLLEGGLCGDGIIESRLGETCEPILTDPSSDCDPQTCKLVSQASSSLRYAICGNGRREGYEECDNGRQNGSPTALCDTSCHLPKGRCGDGLVQVRSGEDCEPSIMGQNAQMTCSAACRYVFSRQFSSSVALINDCSGTECRDGGSDFCGMQDAVCNPANTLPCIQCIPNNPSLPPFTPGNFIPAGIRVSSPSSRSSSSRSSSSSSRLFITKANCGNGVLNAGEQCDQGVENSANPNSFCRPDCTFGRCGDAVLDTPLETCDLGSQNGRPGSACTVLCRKASEALSVLPASVIELPFGTVSSSPRQPGQNPAAASVLTPPVTPVPPGNTNSGPATLAIMALGASAGVAWMRRKKA